MTREESEEGERAREKKRLSCKVQIKSQIFQISTRHPWCTVAQGTSMQHSFEHSVVATGSKVHRQLRPCPIIIYKRMLCK